MYDEDYTYEEEYQSRTRRFRDPGGKSALHPGKRIHPCPTCGRPRMLTAKDKQSGYQCDRCADAAEGGGY
jgi:hypothetical protein